MGRYGTVRYGITVRLDFGKKYDAELRTEFLGKVRYSTKIRYYIFRTVPYTFRTTVKHATHFCCKVLHFCFLHFSFLPITLPRQLPSPLQSPLTISNNTIVKWLNRNAVIIIRLVNHNPAYGEAFINCADLVIVKGRSKKTKYQIKNRYQVIAYGAYLF